MTGSDPSSFDTLRIWDGSQPRAFEEISYQLLKEDAPTDSTVIRTGNPDGGVEWYATLPSGDQHGWQAKHVHGIDALLTAMTESVKRVASARPQLIKLTFVISTNLAEDIRDGEHKTQRDKYNDAVERWKQNISGADRIDFDLIQESDLLDRLAKPEHRGRKWFWWNEPVFDAKWLQNHQDQQAAAAGEKYRPDLQVDLPIQRDLDALGFSDGVIGEFEKISRRTIDACRNLRLTPAVGTPEWEVYETIVSSAGNLVNILDALSLEPETADTRLSMVTEAAKAVDEAIDAASSVDYEQERAWHERKRLDPSTAGPEPPRETRKIYVHDVRLAVTDLLRWINGPVADCTRKGLYFLTGVAGIGKTHMLLDGAARALEEQRPAAVLFGARFGNGDLWSSICDQLGLEPLGRDVLLQAMDAAGEASGITSRRFVIMIDALNETPSPEFWQTHLPELRAAVQQWPHVALAVACRDTYVDIVDESDERAHYRTVTHPGFADYEVEATQKYFDHYELEAPRIPLLTPEFTVPLFLRLYCESLKDEGLDVAPVGHEGRVQIFERFLRTKQERVARRYRSCRTAHELNQTSSLVMSVLEALLDELAVTGREGMPASRSDELAATVIGGSTENASRMIGALQDEGVLTQERLYFGDNNSGDGVRITFQAFSDFLLLKRRLTDVTDPANDTAFVEWLSEQCSWGVQEAAMTALPELYGVEVPDLMGVKKADAPFPEDRDDREAHRRSSRAHHAYHAFVKTLPYRDSTAMTDRTIEILNDSMAVVQDYEIFQAMTALAPQPDNRLNGEGLHQHLARMRMPVRDAFYGIAVYRSLFDESEPIARLARWAARGPYPMYDGQIIELSCIPLVWLLSSPNRRMRDWVTKALVQLLHGHLDVVLLLVERFWNIDDPYVVQRVIVIAYASLMRSDLADRDAATSLVTRVHELAFARPMRPDELMLDAARGVVEYGVVNNLIPESSIESTKRPYGFKAPGNPPTGETLEQRFSSRERQPHSEDFSSIYSSLFLLGDFGRYVVESGIQNFSRYRIGSEYPADTPFEEPRISTRKWRTFERSLSPEQHSLMNRAFEELGQLDELEGALRESTAMTAFDASLTSEQRTLHDNAWVRPRRRRYREDDYPGDRARRWIFMRTLSLGWTPELFGEEDHFIRQQDHGRSEHKPERWGKKYQWMAYHELLARVADTYQTNRRYSDQGPYEGLHQIIAEREIDATLPPIDYRSFLEDRGESASTWHQSPHQLSNLPAVQLPFATYTSDLASFVLDHDSEPTPERFAQLTDDAGQVWIALDWFETQQSDEDLLGNDRQFDQGHHMSSWFVERDNAANVASRIVRQRHDHRDDLVDTHGHVDCCYAGEIGWTPHTCYHRANDWQTHNLDGLDVALVPTIEDYCWEGSLLDSSIGESVSATFPSTFIRDRARLSWSIAGPSWHNAEHGVVAGYVSGKRWHGLLVRHDWLDQFLANHNLALLISGYFERRILDRQNTWRLPHSEGWTAAVMFSGTCDFQHPEILRIEHPQGEH